MPCRSGKEHRSLYSTDISAFTAGASDPTNPTDSQAMVFEVIQLDTWLPELV